MDEYGLHELGVPMPTALKRVMTAQVLGLRALTVLVVAAFAWLTSLSVLASLIVLFVLLSLRDLIGIWFVPPGRRPRSNGGGGPDGIGDRYPRRPFPSDSGTVADEA